MSALLMTIVLNGFTKQEKYFLTKAMTANCKVFSQTLLQTLLINTP